MKVQLQMKDPDFHMNFKGEVARGDWCTKYSEHCEYFRVEIDTETLTGRVIPIEEWK